jgi:hypothetical protein
MRYPRARKAGRKGIMWCSQRLNLMLDASNDGPRIVILSRLSLVGISQMSVATLRR